MTRRAMCTAIGALMLVSAGAASGATKLRTFTPTANNANNPRAFAVNCTTTGQACRPPFRFILKITNNVTVVHMKYTASALHCSGVKVQATVDGVKRRIRGPIGPGSSVLIGLAGLKPGTHTIALQGFGVLGGCNTGRVASWGGDVRFKVAARSAN